MVILVFNYQYIETPNEFIEIMPMIEDLYNNSLNKLDISGFNTNISISLDDLFLYNHSLTRLILNGKTNENVKSFILRNQNCINIIERKFCNSHTI